MSLRILSIVRGTSVDGPGLRTSIYVAGCKHHCQNCHNPESWNFSSGQEWSINSLVKEIDKEGFNVTLSGGDPLFHPLDTKILCEEINKLGLKIWIYTGFIWEEIIRSPSLLEAIKNAEVVVDGKFEEKYYDPDLLFKGSSNQRIIKVAESIRENKIILWHQ